MVQGHVRYKDAYHEHTIGSSSPAFSTPLYATPQAHSSPSYLGYKHIVSLPTQSTMPNLTLKSFLPSSSFFYARKYLLHKIHMRALSCLTPPQPSPFSNVHSLNNVPIVYPQHLLPHISQADTQPSPSFCGCVPEVV